MRVYGASRSQVTGSQRVEFLAMGLLAGILATAGAAAIGQLLARRVFELDLPPGGDVVVTTIDAWVNYRLAGAYATDLSTASLSRNSTAASAAGSSSSLNTCTPARRKAAAVTPSPVTLVPLKLPS